MHDLSTHSKETKKESARERKRAYNRAYRERNRQRLREASRAFYRQNKNLWRARYEAHRESIREYDRLRNLARREIDRPKKRAYRQHYRKHPVNRLAHNLRNRIGKFIRRSGRSESSAQLLGCTFEEFAAYIAAQFLPRMSWANYGKAWHIDHIIPCRAFDLTDAKERQACFHYTNLRPLWAKANLRKRGKITDPQLKLLLPG